MLKMGLLDSLKVGLKRSREAINEIFYMGGEVDEDFWEDLEDTLVMGDMGEIGEAAAARHREAGQLARDLGIERLWATGELSREAAAAFGEGGRWFRTRDELAAALLESPLEGTMVVKASHSMGFSKIVEALKKI